MVISISPVSEEHIFGFHEAVDTVAREKKFLAAKEAHPIGETEKFIRNNIENKHPQFVALNNKNVVGWCDVIPKNKRSFHAHQGILGMGILPEFRGRGLGRKLLDTTLNAAFDYGLTRIELTVWESNCNAILLYQKFGFEIEGTHRNAIFVDGRYANLLSMALLKDSTPKG